MFRTYINVVSFLESLRLALRQEIETREKSHVISCIDSTPSTSGEESFPTAGALLSSSTERQHKADKPRAKCVYCEDSHKAEKCDKVTSINERLSLLRRHRRFFNCLGANHMTKNYYSRGRCQPVEGNTTRQSANQISRPKKTRRLTIARKHQH